MESIGNKLKTLEKTLLQTYEDSAGKSTRDLLIVQNRLYAQLESLSWLQRQLAIKGPLPPLRGWATSPDVLLRLHAHIIAIRPRVIVEIGSGASTLVIADALRQNGVGKLISIEHSDHYGAQTLGMLHAESLEGWVDLRIGELEAWEGEHLNPEDAEKPSLWYPVSLLEGVENVDLLWVDGPPGATCLFSRYPALPVLADKLSPKAEVWMDDTIRQEEKYICERWASDHGFELEYLTLEKGLGRLSQQNKCQALVHVPADHKRTVRLDEHQDISVESYERVILEYGSKYVSTIATAAPDRFTMCVEANRKTVRALNKQQHSFISSVVIFHAEIAGNGSEALELGEAHSYEFSPYILDIWKQPFFIQPDLILLSGPIKSAVFLEVLKHIKRPTRLLFDDYIDESERLIIERVLQPVRMMGTWAEFSLVPGIAQANESEILCVNDESRE